jgi:alpha-beta hydrolase superfamily lysophospholipase
MCPVCLSTLAAIAAGATSTGGLAAIAGRLRGHGSVIAASARPHLTSSPDPEGNDHA